MMSLREATTNNTTPRHNADFLAGLFDDITAKRVLDEMNLITSSDDDVSRNSSGENKRDALMMVGNEVPMIVRSEPCRPRKKCCLFSPLSTSSFRSRASTHNLLAPELSFPPLEDAIRKTAASSPSRVLYPSVTGTQPRVPQIALTRRRRVSLRSSSGGQVSGSDSSSSASAPLILAAQQATGSLPCAHFIAPDNGSNSVSLSTECKFGWFVDLDHHPQQHRQHSLFKRHLSLLSPLSQDMLTFQSPVAPHAPPSQEKDAELEWAMAVDTIDSIFGGDHSDDA